MPLASRDWQTPRPQTEKKYSASELECLQLAAEILSLPLWKLLLAFSTTSPTVNSDSIDVALSQNSPQSYSADQLYTLQSAAEILDVPLWRLLQIISIIVPARTATVAMGNEYTSSADTQITPYAQPFIHQQSFLNTIDRYEDLPFDFSPSNTDLSISNVPSGAGGVTTGMFSSAEPWLRFEASDSSLARPTNLEREDSQSTLQDRLTASETGLALTSGQFSDGLVYVQDDAEWSNTGAIAANSDDFDVAISNNFSIDEFLSNMDADNSVQQVGTVGQSSHRHVDRNFNPQVASPRDCSNENSFFASDATCKSSSIAISPRQHSLKVNCSTNPKQKSIGKVLGRVTKDNSYGRSRKACMRCRFNRRTCLPNPRNPSGPCVECEGVSYTMSNLGCLYYIITDSILFRSMVDPISSRPYELLDPDFSILNPIASWDVPEVKFIELTQGYGPPLQLCVHSFSPSALKVEGIPESAQYMFNHPYGFTDLKKTEQSIKQFIIRSLPDYFTKKVDKSDLITTYFFDMAYRIRKSVPTNLLQNVLDLWTTARFIEGGWRFCGSETLGLSPNKAGILPITLSPIIDYQFASIVVQRLLLPLRKKVLRELQRLTLEKKPNNWLVIMLSTFILLHSYGLLMKQQRNFAFKRNARVRYTSMPLVRSIHSGAKTILAHFHYLNKGQKPFDLDWTSDGVPRVVAKIAELDTEQLAFVRAIVGEVRKNTPLFTSLANSQEYETDHWFTGQMFLPNWLPPDTIEHSPPA